jgi:hypothetical protein
VLLRESEEKKKIILKTLKKLRKYAPFIYLRNFNSAFFKIKTGLILFDLYKEKGMALNLTKYELKPLSSIPFTSKKDDINRFMHNEDVDLPVDSPKELLNKNPYSTNTPLINAEFNNLRVNSNDETQSAGNQNLIKTVVSLEFAAIKQNNRRAKERYIFTTSEHGTYNKELREAQNYTHTRLNIVNRKSLPDENKKLETRAMIKLIIYAVFFVGLWVLIFFMISIVYYKYEDNMYKITIAPIVSVVLIKFTVVQNILILVFTFVLYKWGRQFYAERRSTTNLSSLLFRFGIPVFAKANHMSVIDFQNVLKELETSEKREEEQILNKK